MVDMAQSNSRSKGGRDATAIRESPDGSKDYVELDGRGGYRVIRSA
jgi:hypothetical protein